MSSIPQVRVSDNSVQAIQQALDDVMIFARKVAQEIVEAEMKKSTKLSQQP
jgi:hypothetical protein